MRATSAKVELDLLSLPQGERTLQPFNANNVNPTFWINRKDPDGQVRNAFLCKSPNPNPQIGLPPGGEVIREALVGRAAQTFAGATGIDLNMPETHVVSVEPGYLPNGGNQSVLCSVQEARESQGGLKDLSAFRQLDIDPEQVGALAIFDVMTLNTDRHSGNVLVDDKKNLIPIDHGYSLVEPTDEGNERIANSMAGPNNALLKIPNAHRPMSEKTLKKLKALDPSSFAKSLKKDRDLIAEEHPGMNNLVSDQAIESARRSALFVKLAARNKPPLSPASIQVAFGTAAKQLLSPEIKKDSDFTKIAQGVIDRIAPRQEIVKQVCIASVGQFNALVRKAADLGWPKFQEAGAATDGMLWSDPLLLSEIVSSQIKRDSKKKEAVQLQEIQSGMAPVDQAKAKLLELKLGLVQDFSQFLSRDERMKINEQSFRATSSGTVDDKLHYANLLVESTFDTAFQRLLTIQQDLSNTYALPENVRYWLGVAISKQDLPDLAQRVKDAQASVTHGTVFTRQAFQTELEKLKPFLEDYDVALDVYLRDFPTAEQAHAYYLNSGEFNIFKGLVDKIESDITTNVILEKTK